MKRMGQTTGKENQVLALSLSCSLQQKRPRIPSLPRILEVVLASRSDPRHPEQREKLWSSSGPTFSFYRLEN